MKYSLFNSTPYETHMLVYERIKPESEVLDIGCATGYFARKLKEKDCKVWGIEKDAEAIKEAKKYCEETFLLDLDTYSFHPRGVHSATPGMPLPLLPFQKKFDYILMLDVIEHLNSPQPVLQLMKKYLKKDGKMIISTPNIAFISIRLSLLSGRFNYRDLGILDKSHLHLYTKRTFIEFINSCGLKIIDFDVASGFSQITKIGKYLNLIPKYWQYKITKLFDTVLGYQFIVVCTPPPSGES